MSGLAKQHLALQGDAVAEETGKKKKKKKKKRRGELAPSLKVKHCHRCSVEVLGPCGAREY